MKNKITVILSAALAIVGIVAIVTPIGVAVSSQQKINDMTNEVTEMKDKNVAGLKPTEAFKTLVIASQTAQENETAALTRLNEIEDKKTLFTIINENGNELKDAQTSAPIPEIIADNFEISTSGVWKVNIIINWDLTKDYNIPYNIVNTAPLVWGPAITPRANINSLLNTIDGVKEATDTTALQTALNAPAADATILSALDNGDKIILGEITVATPTAAGFSINIPFTAKAGFEIEARTLTINNFKISPETPTLKTGHIAIIQAIDGVAEATDETTLQAALRADLASVLTIIDNAHAIDLRSAITVAAPTATGFNISIPYTAKDGFNITDGVVRVNNFKITLTKPTLKAEHMAMIQAIDGVAEAIDATTLDAALTADKLAVANSITNSHAINIGDIVVTAPTATGFEIRILYTAKNGFDVDSDTLIISDFRINATVALVDNPSATLNGITAVKAATDEAILQTALRANSSTVLTAINNSQAIELGNITVAAPTAAGFSISIPYTVKPGFNVTGINPLIIPDFKIIPTPPTVKSDADNTLNGITAVKAATDETTLQTALKVNSSTVLTAINNSQAIELGNITVAAPTAAGFRISIPYSSKNGFNVTGVNPLIIPDFKIALTTPSLSGEHIATIQAIDGVAEATDIEALQTALNTDPAKASIIGLITYSNEITNPMINIIVAADEANYTLTIVTTVAGFNIPNIVISDFSPTV